MLTEGLINFFVALVDFFLGLLPESAVPDWLMSADGYFAQIWEAGAGLGAWLPWSLIGTVFAAVLSCMGIGFAIKVVRLVASYFTAGGGSAG